MKGALLLFDWRAKGTVGKRRVGSGLLWQGQVLLGVEIHLRGPWGCFCLCPWKSPHSEELSDLGFLPPLTEVALSTCCPVPALDPVLPIYSHGKGNLPFPPILPENVLQHGYESTPKSHVISTQLRLLLEQKWAHGREMCCILWIFLIDLQIRTYFVNLFFSLRAKAIKEDSGTSNRGN